MMDTLKILITDDEPGMRLGMQRALRNFTVLLSETQREVRYECDLAESGEEALQKMTEHCPDILLLDYKMPGMTGLDVLAQVEERGLDVLVVMVTAYASIQTAVAATKKGAYDFLPKPFTPDELRLVVEKSTRHLMARREAQRLAAEKRQVRFEFISVLAHELKAPLGAIEGYLNILKDHTLGDEVDCYDSQVERCLIRLDGMKKLILDLLDLTRIESGRRKREPVSLDVVETARRAIETMLPSAASRGIALELSAPSEVPLVADRSDLEIIFNNLVSNAVKYNRDQGRVDVTLSREDGAVRIRVADTGIGMNPEEVAKLFQEFVRIKNRKTRDVLGSGLGLSIVKKLVDMVSGRIQVTSEPDKGTTFEVLLPDAEPALGNTP